MNYTVQIRRYRVVRETGGPDPRVLDGPPAVVALLTDLDVLPDDGKEHAVTLMLDVRNRLVAVHEISMGSLTSSIVSPREVFGPALRSLGVAALILAHNHPSGDPTPSHDDLALTRRLRDAGKLLDVEVRDHLIIGNGSGRWTSLASMGVLT